MDSYNVRLNFFEENCDGLTPPSVDISFSFGEFQFASYIYNFDETPVDEVRAMIHAMTGEMSFARISQGFNNGSSTITCENNIVTFETSHFAQSTTFKCIVNESLVYAFIQLEKCYSLM